MISAKLLKKDFIGKSGILFTSSLISSLISLAGFVILSKVYSLELMGVFFAVLAVANIISVFVHFGMIQAIPLMSDEEIKVGASFLIAISFIALVTGLLALLFSAYLSIVLLASAFVSLGAVLEIILLRESRVKFIASYRIILPLASFSSAIFMNLLFDVDGLLLVLGYFFGFALVNLYSLNKVARPLAVKLTVTNIKSLIQTYERFPRFIGPGIIFSTAALSIPSVLGLHYFGAVAVASYNLAYKLVLAPMSILGQALGQSYTSDLSSSYRNKNALASNRHLDGFLFSLASFVSILIFFLFPWVSKLLFGADHLQITYFAYALIPLVFSMLSVAPLSNLFHFTNGQKTILKIQFIILISSLVSFFIGVMFNSFLVGTAVYSVLTLIRYIWVYHEIRLVRKTQC